jgi:ribosomal protein L32
MCVSEARRRQRREIDRITAETVPAAPEGESTPPERVEEEASGYG